MAVPVVELLNRRDVIGEKCEGRIYGSAERVSLLARQLVHRAWAEDVDNQNGDAPEQREGQARAVVAGRLRVLLRMHNWRFA